MEYREYGKTGKKVSVLGLGAMRFENPEDIDRAAETVLRAHQKGINYFDTAPAYCGEKSEIIVGRALQEIKKSGKPFYVSTKSHKKTGSELRRELETSLERLGVDKINFYHCWYVLTMDDWESRKKGGAVAEILKAKDEGLIEHASFSTHLAGPDIARVIDEDYFEGVTLGYSAINFPYREEGIAAAGRKNIGVVIMNPLGGGMIPLAENSFEFLKIRPGQNIIEGALHFLMADRRISSFIVGFRNPDDVDSAVAAVDSYVPYTAEDVEKVKKGVTEGLDSLCTTCMYCKDCPEDIPVWSFVETCNHILLKTGTDIAFRLKGHWGVSPDLLDKCIQCGQCEAACTQKLPIMERFELLKKTLASAG